MEYTRLSSPEFARMSGAARPVELCVATHPVRQRREWQLVRLRNKRGRQEFWRVATAGAVCDCSPPAA